MPIQDDQYRNVGMRRDPGYRPPSGKVGLSMAPAMPAGHVDPAYEPTGRMYSAGPSHNEADQLSSFMSSVPMSSPWARFQQDRGRQNQINTNVASIANDRSASRYYGPPSQGPIGMKPPSAPAPVDPAEQGRIDARNARYEASDARMAAAPRPPTLIPDPSKVGAGAAAAAQTVQPFVTRLRDPSQAPSRGQAIRSGIGLRSQQAAQRPQPQPQAAGDPARGNLMGHFDSQMADALAKGDMSMYAELAAQKGALDSGGFVGLQNHVDERSMARAKLQEVGAKVGLTNSKSGQAATPEEAKAAMYGKTGNVEAGDVAAYNARHLAGTYDPTDAQRIIESEYGHTKDAFKPDSELPDIHAHLMATVPQLMGDPRSRFAMAARDRIKQMFGAELPNQLMVPPEPFRSNLGTVGIGAPVGTWFANMANNAIHGHFNTNPITEYDRRKSAADWFNAR